MGFWTAMALHEGGTEEYWMAACALTLWGTFRGFTYAPLEALFADSVPTEDRAKLQTFKFVCTTLGASAGPLAAVVLFKYFGDDWTLSQLRVVIAVGTGFALIPFGLLFLLQDKHSLDATMSGPAMEILDDKPNAKRVRWLCFTADAIGGVASG